MRARRILFGSTAALIAVAAVAVVLYSSLGQGSAKAATAARPWPTRNLPGSVRLAGDVPLSVRAIPGAARSKSKAYVGRHARSAQIRLDFSFPLRDKAGLNALIAREAKTHRYLSRAQIYARYSPPETQVKALESWLVSKGFRISHVGLDRLGVTAYAPSAVVEKALKVKVNDYIRPAQTIAGIKLEPYVYYSNATAPTVPARFGIQTISGLSDIDRFFTQAQLSTHSLNPTPGSAGCGGDDDSSVNPLCTDVRTGGYFPSDLKGLYDIAGHGIDATGQTVGFTLWTAAERQKTMDAYAAATGDTPITIDPGCNAATVPSPCAATPVAPNHLLFIFENGNSQSNVNFNSNVETGLDIEAAHGIADGVAMKYYAAECNATVPVGSGLTNAGCNGSDTGLLDALEDAASDPTLHSVSNSWAFGGDAEWGASDPFLVPANNILALAAAAGTTFYFSTGDSGTYQSGYPSDSQYVVGVGGTSTYSTTNPAVWSTTATWSGGGSWCTNVIARPSWQTGPGVTANAPCPGRAIPDVSAIADPNTGLKFFSTTNDNPAPSGIQSGQVGGTSLAAPVMNGLQALTQAFVAQQTFNGSPPALGFMAPLLYQLGNGGHASSYFRDIQCGNTANPTSGPDGDAATAGWDAATGWGEPDWFNFATGIALDLGATNLSVPPSLSQHFAWSCAKTPSNSTERSMSCPTSSTCYAVGAASGATPWYGKFLPSGAWGAVNTFFKSTDGGQTWFPSNSDMFSIACTSGSTCMEVGAGGRERRTTDSGTTWTDVATAQGNNKPLTQVTCPSSSICYAVGDRGNAMKSIDGGQTWSWLDTGDGNPIYGLSCPSTTVCYATDIYAWVYKTADGGSTWTRLQTPITTPGTDVPGSGGPNPFAGLMAISCSDVNTCVASGLYVVVSGQTIPSTDPPIITTADGGTTWTLQTSNAGDAPVSTTLSAAAIVGATNVKVASVTGFAAGRTMVVDAAGVNPETVTITTVGTSGATGTGVTFTPALAFAHASGVTVTTTNPNSPNYLHGLSCLPGTTTCTAVGRSGAIVTTTNLTIWTPATSGTTNMLNSVTCLSTSFCMAVGQNGTVDVDNSGTWTATTGNGGTGMLASVTCQSTSVCYATGKQGITIATTDGGAHWAIQAGGGTTQQMNGISCATASVCTAAGNAGTILATTNGGQTWTSQTSGTTNALNGVACTSTTACVAVGAAGTARVTTDGSTWSAGTTNTPNALNGVSCSSAAACVAVGAAGTAVTSSNVGSSWSLGTSGTTAALNAVACPSATCYAVGAASGGSAVIVKSTDNGNTWSAETSNTPNPLSGVACVNASYCFTDGTFGTVMATSDGGVTWTQQGNPLSGPTTALNATSIALLGATCTPARCMIGTGTQGDIMDTPLLTVTLNASGVYGTTPNLTNLSPGNPAIGDTPPSEAANVTGSLTCSTTAVQTSNVGTYPISACSGLADDGFNIVYDYADSSYTVTKAPLTVTADNQSRLFGSANPPLTATLSGFVLGQTLATSGVTGSAACMTTATVFSTGGTYPITCTVGTLAAMNYSFGPFVPGTLTVTYTAPCITTTRNGQFTISSGQVICIDAGGKIAGPLTVNPGGVLDIEGGSVTGPFRSQGSGVIRLCGASVSGPLTINGSTGLVLVGGDAATGTCAGNTISGPADLESNTAGVEFNGNKVSGPLTIKATTGTLPPPDTGSVHATGNTVSGPTKIS